MLWQRQQTTVVLCHQNLLRNEVELYLEVIRVIKSRPTRSVSNPNLKDSKNEEPDQPKDMTIKKNPKLSEKVGKTVSL